jgi:ureidoacrylate peracid hydrolase
VETNSSDVFSGVLADPGRLAVIVVDMQRDFCSTDGAFARAGVDVSANERIVDPLGRFVDVLRGSGALVVWIRQLSSEAYRSPAIGRRLRRAPERALLCADGSPGAELAQGLVVHPADVVVQKFRYSAFAGSSLQVALRSADIRTVIVVGTAANACVDSTVRDAAQLDYDVIVAEDLVGYTHARLAAASLENLDHHFAVVCRSAEVLAAMGLAPSREGLGTR